jgi:hypothetical protein
MPHDPGIIHPRYAGFAQERNASDLCLPRRLLANAFGVASAKAGILQPCETPAFYAVRFS